MDVEGRMIPAAACGDRSTGLDDSRAVGCCRVSQGVPDVCTEVSERLIETGIGFAPVFDPCQRVRDRSPVAIESISRFTHRQPARAVGEVEREMSREYHSARPSLGRLQPFSGNTYGICCNTLNRELHEAAVDQLRLTRRRDPWLVNIVNRRICMHRSHLALKNQRTDILGGQTADGIYILNLGERTDEFEIQ